MARVIKATTNRADSTGGRPAVSRRVVACLLAAWLGLGLQPCAVAAGAAHDCPHCPTENLPQMPAHHGHHADAAVDGPACASMQADCCDEAVAGVDARSGKLLPKQGGEQAALVAPSAPVVPPAPRHADRSAVDPPDNPPPSRPLHRIYCVYLD